jgi:hypothetical protein
MTEEIAGEFAPNAANTNGTGKDKIVSLILPNAATKVKGSFYQNFTNLTSVSGDGVETIDNGAFYSLNGLSSVSFPKATTIGNGAFENCTNLITVDFMGEATEGHEASIGQWAFYGCTKLETVNFLAATIIEYNAFYNCVSLTEVDFPAATTIKTQAFDGCTSLSSVDLRSAETFLYQVFQNTGTESLTVTLGSHAPVLYDSMFLNVSGSKTVTVEVPEDAEERYGDIPATYSSGTDVNWGNGFRGAGYTANGNTDSGSVNQNVTVRIKHIGAPDETDENVPE